MPTEPRTVGDVFRMFFPGYPGCIGSDNGTACPVRMGLIAAGLLAPMDSEGADALIIPLAGGPVVAEAGNMEVAQEELYSLAYELVECGGDCTDGDVMRILTALFPAGIKVVTEVRVVFDGPPGPTCGRFVECETSDGASVNAGDWHEREDGLWELRMLACLKDGKEAKP